MRRRALDIVRHSSISAPTTNANTQGACSVAGVVGVAGAANVMLRVGDGWTPVEGDTLAVLMQPLTVSRPKNDAAVRQFP